MDTSETYKKMCDKAFGIIQRIENGETFWFPLYPRQDQLQEMIGNFDVCKEAIFNAGYDNNEYGEYWGKPYDYWEMFTSMEQLWLAFVMKEKFSKVWNGEKWEG